MQFRISNVHAAELTGLAAKIRLRSRSSRSFSHSLYMSKYATALLSSAAILGLPALAHAQSAAPAQATTESATVADVVVTGSNIRRAAAEGINPVQVIGREELDTSGKVTVADLLRSISANTGNSSNETSNSGWASGSAGIGLRGLSQKNTLVLLNGRRVANYGFPSGGLSDTFVNLNALPIVATQRLEVLKDGASAVYGSDAVAGVVTVSYTHLRAHETTE